MAIEQNAKLVTPVDDFLLVENFPVRLPLAFLAEHFMQGQHGIIAGMIGIMAGGAIDCFAVRPMNREVIGDGNRLVMGDEKPVMRLCRGRPCPDARIGTRLHQIDRGLTARLMRAGICRHPFFMRAPTEFCGLQAFGHETLDRPGVDEHIGRLRGVCTLRIAFGDMNTLHAETMRQGGPFIARGRLRTLHFQITLQIKQGLLDEP